MYQRNETRSLKKNGNQNCIPVSKEIDLKLIGCITQWNPNITNSQLGTGQKIVHYIGVLIHIFCYLLGGLEN